jgi:hypothetical protein
VRSWPWSRPPRGSGSAAGCAAGPARHGAAAAPGAGALPAGDPRLGQQIRPQQLRQDRRTGPCRSSAAPRRSPCTAAGAPGAARNCNRPAAPPASPSRKPPRTPPACPPAARRTGHENGPRKDRHHTQQGLPLVGVQNIQIWPAKVLIEIRPTLAQPKCALRERRGMVTECDGLVGGESAGCRLSRVSFGSMRRTSTSSRPIRCPAGQEPRPVTKVPADRDIRP